MAQGVDYAWSRPSLILMREWGAEFVCRYLSHDTTGKNLTLAEAQAITNAGMWLVVVWETTASRALAGTAAGAGDAADALAQARALGMPDDRPIFFAVDFDATAAQQAKIHEYLAGAASVIGVNRLGMYGGYGPVSRAFDAGKISYGWQTYAWSNGKWDGRAGIQQYLNGASIGGANVDFNRSVLDDYGQWKVGESPMALTAADKQWLTSVLVPAVAKAVWGTDNIVPASDDDLSNKFWTPSFHLSSMGRMVRSIMASIAAMNLDVDETAVVAGVLSGLSPETLADAIATHLGPDVANATADALSRRLES